MLNKIAERAEELLNAKDWNEITNSRIEVTKNALQLTPEQAKYWPPIENAIRSRAEARHARLQALATPPEKRRDIIEVMRDRANNLTERGANLKKLADAWQPLFQTLDATQKSRLRALALYTMHEARDALEARRVEMMNEPED
jgi:zinc resistance-associated protein